MEAEIDSKNAKHVDTDCQQNNARPAEKPGKKCQQRKQMTKNKPDKGVSLELHRTLPRQLRFSAMIDQADEAETAAHLGGRDILLSTIIVDRSPSFSKSPPTSCEA